MFHYMFKQVLYYFFDNGIKTSRLHFQVKHHSRLSSTFLPLTSAGQVGLQYLQKVHAHSVYCSLQLFIFFFLYCCDRPPWANSRTSHKNFIRTLTQQESPTVPLSPHKIFNQIDPSLRTGVYLLMPKQKCKEVCAVTQRDTYKD